MGLKYTYHHAPFPEIVIGPSWRKARVRLRGTSIFWIKSPKPSIIPFPILKQLLNIMVPLETVLWGINQGAEERKASRDVEESGSSCPHLTQLGPCKRRGCAGTRGGSKIPQRFGVGCCN